MLSGTLLVNPFFFGFGAHLNWDKPGVPIIKPYLFLFPVFPPLRKCPGGGGSHFLDAREFFTPPHKEESSLGKPSTDITVVLTWSELPVLESWLWKM